MGKKIVAIAENDMIGFRDDVFSKTLEINMEKLQDKISQIDHEQCLQLFREYMDITEKTMY